DRAAVGGLARGRFMANGYPGIARAVAVLAVALSCSPTIAAEPAATAEYHKTVEPILSDYCVTCHGGASAKAGVSFDQDPATLVNDRDLWLKALKMIRAGMMPPKGKDKPSAEQTAQLETWIKRSVFRIDPKDPDPGRVTLRRLNRTEYRNTIRDLLGVDFNTDAEFPNDDTGHGFDTIGDVLTISPLLLERYISAAKAIVAQAVPTQAWAPAEKRIPGQRFTPTDVSKQSVGTKRSADGPLALSYYKAATVTYPFVAENAGRYQVVLDVTASET